MEENSSLEESGREKSVPGDARPAVDGEGSPRAFGVVLPPGSKLNEALEAVRSSSVAEPRLESAVLNLVEDAPEAQHRVLVEENERRKIEKSLTRSQARLSAALVAGRMGAWEWNPKDDEIFVSETIRDVFGLLPGETIRSGAQLQAFVHREDQGEREMLLARAAREWTGWRSEFRIVRPIDGRIAWVEERAEALRDEETGEMYFTGVVWDIDERKRAETALHASQERFRLIVESARDYAILSLDSARKITSWNSGAEAILGWTQAEALGRSGDIVFTPEDRAAHAPELEASRALADGRAMDERWHVRRNGERFWGSGVMMVMRDAARNAVGFLKVFRDQTEAKKSEEMQRRRGEELQRAFAEMNQARQEAEAANRTKDQFLAALSHELRTPLTPVLMTVEALLGRKDLPPRVMQALEMILRNIQLEKQFIDDLLDITRIAHGKLHLVEGSVDLHEAIQRAVEISTPDITCKSQRLTVELEARDTALRGDFARLQQVFWNLLKNASKFTPEGGEIGVRSRDEGAEVVVEVWDTGRGIEPARLDDIFEAFRQEDESVARSYGGLGLGLAIAKASVLGHGGSIQAASCGPGTGATFTVRLPRPVSGTVQ